MVPDSFASSIARAAEDPSGGHWDARLGISLSHANGRTRADHLSHRGPLRVQRLFHPEPDGTAHVYVLHPPGGLASADRLSIEVALGPGARAVVTTPGATKAYRRRAGMPGARQSTSLRVGSHACLEHVPQEAIVFEGADLELRTAVELEDGANFLGWEIVCLGRPAAGEVFRTGRVKMHFDLHRKGRLTWTERGSIEGGTALLHSPWGLRDQAAFGTMVATDAPLEVMRESLALVDEEANVAATRIGDLTIVRALGPDASRVRTALSALRRTIRIGWGRSPIEPAIWRT